MIVVYLGWRLVDIYLGTGHNAKPASREIRDKNVGTQYTNVLIFPYTQTFTIGRRWIYKELSFYP